MRQCNVGVDASATTPGPHRGDPLVIVVKGFALRTISGPHRGDPLVIVVKGFALMTIPGPHRGDPLMIVDAKVWPGCRPKMTAEE